MSKPVSQKEIDNFLKKHNLELLRKQESDIDKKLDLLNHRINELSKKKLEIQKSIKKKQVSGIDPEDVLDDIMSSIEKYTTEYDSQISKNTFYGDVHNIYADGTIDYCRNTARGNWHNVFEKIFNDVPDDLNNCFIKFTKTGEGYATMSEENSYRIREKIQLLYNIYTYQ